MKALHLIGAAAAVVIVGAIVAWEWRHKTSPGPLHASHAALPELAGAGGCVACHGEGAAELADACLICHEAINAQIRDGRGLHAGTPAGAVRRCGECHVEHTGGTVALVTERSFAAGGVPRADSYDHRHVEGFDLQGKHATLACVKCHPNAHANSLAKGEKRFLGATRQCVACHDDAHRGSFGVECQSCHGQDLPFDRAPGFSHTDRFVLKNVHAVEKCDKCHQPGTPTSVAASLAGNREVRACVACHTDPHEGKLGGACQSCHGTVRPFKDASEFVHTGAFALEGGHAGRACVDCHTRPGPYSIESLRAHPQEARTCASCHQDPHKGTMGVDCNACHGTTGPFKPATGFRHPDTFPLTFAHSGRACAECHQDANDRSVAALRARPLAPRLCSECHRSGHSERMLAGIAAQSGGTVAETCGRCHASEDRTFQPSGERVTPDVHGAAGFPLTPPHDKAACAECHVGIDLRAQGEALRARARTVFPGRGADDCESCHRDPHAGQFASTATHGRCVECHARTHFTPSAFEVERHDRTRFALAGAHRAVACASCHKKEAELTRFVPTPTACASCHRDVHAGKFDAPGAPRIPGKEGCARCHTSENFRAVAWTAGDHGAWTGYTLLGGHASVSCVACHPRVKPDASGRTLGVASRACASCHQDPHAGQFAKDNATDCARCHSEIGPFTKSTFDHQRDSAFKLDQTHARLECAACHRRVQIGPVSTVRYRPLGANCQDCHDPRTLNRKEQP